MLREPLEPQHAKRLLRDIVASGSLVFTHHVETRMVERKLTADDCARVLRSGQVDPGEFEGGTWRYPVRTPHVCVVVAFRSETAAVVVSAWRE